VLLVTARQNSKWRRRETASRGSSSSWREWI